MPTGFSVLLANSVFEQPTVICHLNFHILWEHYTLNIFTDSIGFFSIINIILHYPSFLDENEIYYDTSINALLINKAILVFFANKNNNKNY